MIMTDYVDSFTRWLNSWMHIHGVGLFGVSDLREFHPPEDETGKCFPFGVSFAIPMDPHIMASVQQGPDQAYADEYERVNKRINEVAYALSSELRSSGVKSMALAASDRTDTINIKGDFPHKTAATRAGLGWIGRHCQLVTREFGSWVRLGTVFTDMQLSADIPIEKGHCGNCTLCVDACPAKALKGNAWYPGIAREEILDVNACDAWKKEHYFRFHEGHNCGICSGVCPYGLRVLKRDNIKTSDD